MRSDGDIEFTFVRIFFLAIQDVFLPDGNFCRGSIYSRCARMFQDNCSTGVPEYSKSTIASLALLPSTRAAGLFVSLVMTILKEGSVIKRKEFALMFS